MCIRDSRHPECLLAISQWLQQHAADFIGARPCAGNRYSGAGQAGNAAQQPSPETSQPQGFRLMAGGRLHSDIENLEPM